MNPCCSGFSCDLKNVTKSDLDRFTDKIENVLSDEKGRKLFRNYMITCNMKRGIQTLNIWEKIEKLHHRRRDNDDTTYKNSDIDRLIDDAERIEYFDYDVVKNLFDAHEEKNNEKLNDAINVLKVESTKALRKEYDKFRSFYSR